MTLHVRVSDEVAETLRALAKADNRTVSGYVAALIARHLAEKPEKKGRK